MRHAVIWGRRRQGKSTLALSLGLSQKRKPTIIFDPCAQFRAYPEYDSAVDGIDNETPIYRVGSDGDPEDAFQVLMDELDGGAWEWADYTLIVDEASFLQRPQSMHPALARLIRQAPDDICVIQTLHRPSETHPTVRSLASDFFFFHTYLERDVSNIEKNFGPELALAVSKLAEHQVIHWWLQPGGNPAWQIWSAPEEWYVKIGDDMTQPNSLIPSEEPEHEEAEEAPTGSPAENEVTTATASEIDPVRELLRVNREQIETLQKQNKKLRERVRKSRETRPLTEAASRPIIEGGSSKPGADAPNLSKDLDWIEGKTHE